MRRLRLTTLTALAGLVLVSACHHGGSAEGPTPGGRTRNMINITEIQDGMARGIGNAYDLIVEIHPEWLRTRYVGSNQYVPIVYQDLNRLGGLRTLQSLNLAGIHEIRLLSSSEAQGELGLDNLGGAIVIVTR